MNDATMDAPEGATIVDNRMIRIPANGNLWGSGGPVSNS